MSILLEALKKSEAQRKLGSTPTLDSPGASEHVAAEDERIWIPAVMILLTVSVIGWTGLMQFQRPNSLTAIPVSAAEQEPKTAGTESLRDRPEDPQNSRTGQSAKTPVMDFTAPKTLSAPVVSAGTSGSNPGGDARQRLKKAPPPGLNRRSAVSVASTDESLSAASLEQPPDETTGSDSATASTRSKEQVEPSVPDSVSYWQIPQSVRQDMPELRITVLVYSDNPADRFLLINGQRLREKESLENGVVLDQIRRDRAIFNFRNYRFYLKN